MADLEPTDRTRVRRKPGRASYERELIHAILDEALVCHAGFVADGQPYVIPTIHARVGELLYLHGSPLSRALNTLADGLPCCVTATLIDELVLARSARQHSLNYRSVMVFGSAQRVADPAEKAVALQAVVEHVVEGRSGEVRAPDAKELDTTEILSLALDEASAKVREGPPIDKPGDQDRPVWAGQLPIEVSAGDPIAVTDLAAGVVVPSYLSSWRSR